MKNTIPQFPDFIQLSISHKKLFYEINKTCRTEISELIFSELFLWRSYFKPFLSFLNKNICIKIVNEDNIFYYPPLGNEHFIETLLEILTFQRSTGKTAEVCSVPETYIDKIRWGFPEVKITADRNDADYVYLSADLSNLKGSIFDGKRNHLKRFMLKYKHELIDLEAKALQECLKLQEEWCNLKKCSGDQLLLAENEAIIDAIANFTELDLIGCAIKVNNKIQAFSIASQLNKDTAVILFEKANPQISGIYQAINQMFSSRLSEKYTFLNREQDHGIAGLRKSKLSYHPHHMVKKYRVSL